MTEADSMTVGGRKCGAVLRQDPSRRCQRPAGWGTEHPGWARCKLHGGASPGGRKAAAREMAHAMMPTLGRDLEIEPTDALLVVVHREAGRLAWLREEIELLGPGGDVTDTGSLLSVLAKMDARPQHAGQRLARLVDVGQQWVKAKPALEGARRAVFLGVRRDERGVDIDVDERGARAGVPGRLA